MATGIAAGLTDAAVSGGIIGKSVERSMAAGQSGLKGLLERLKATPGDRAGLGHALQHRLSGQEIQAIAKASLQHRAALEDKQSERLKKLNESFSAVIKKIDSGLITSLNRMGLALGATAALGLHDTVQGYQLAYQFERLAYEIADSLLPIIKDMTKAVSIVNFGLHKMNASGSGLHRNLIEGAILGTMVGWGRVFGAVGTGAKWGARGLGYGAEYASGLSNAMGPGLAPANYAMRGIGLGGSGLGLAAGGFALAGWAAYEAKQASEAGRSFANNMHMTSEGWRGGTAADYDAAQAERRKGYYNASGIGKLGDKDKDQPTGEHLTEIFHTSFGSVDKLWDQMQSLATENPAGDTQTQQLDVLSAIALTLTNILEWLEGVPLTTKEEAMRS